MSEAITQSVQTRCSQMRQHVAGDLLMPCSECRSVRVTCEPLPTWQPEVAEHSVGNDVSVAIEAQNPNLEAAWRTIAWWEQTCTYWYEEAQKGYALRDGGSHA
jgi:hypothetical protein